MPLDAVEDLSTVIVALRTCCSTTLGVSAVHFIISEMAILVDLLPFKSLVFFSLLYEILRTSTPPLVRGNIARHEGLSWRFFSRRFRVLGFATNWFKSVKMVFVG